MTGSATKRATKRAHSPESGIPDLHLKQAKRVCSLTSVTSSYTNHDLDEGDCAILAENKLFRLRRSLLINNSPVFAELLHRPTHTKAVTVFLHLEEDSAEDLEALCWALTTEPDQRPEKVNPGRLKSIFCMADKYKITDCRMWSKQGLINFSKKVRRVGRLPSVEDLQAILRVTIQCPADVMLQRKFIQGWMYRLRNDPTLSPKNALDFAEKYNLREFQGHIYYHEMIRINPILCAHRHDSSTYTFGNGFNSRQSASLFRGFESLKNFWENLRHAPKQTRRIISSRRLDHNRTCAEKWNSMWNKGGVAGATLPQQGQPRKEHVFPPIFALRSLTKSTKRTSESHCGCHFAKWGQRLAVKLSKNIADHFLGPAISLVSSPAATEESDDDQVSEENGTRESDDGEVSEQSSGSAEEGDNINDEKDATRVGEEDTSDDSGEETELEDDGEDGYGAEEEIEEEDRSEEEG